MPVSNLASVLVPGTTCFSAWITMPEPLVAESAARAGFRSVTLDMQHGTHDAVSVMRCIGAVALAGLSTVVRIPVGDFAMASRALDMGATGIIAPMINSAADAEAFVKAVKYLPIGERSWGATRAMQVFGSADGNAYLAAANSGTLAFAMIETREAIEALDDILAVPGIDGIFIGPSDLSIALSFGANVNPMRADNQDAAALILAKARAAGKPVAMFALTGAQGHRYRSLGYDFVALGADSIYFALGAAAMLREASAD